MERRDVILPADDASQDHPVIPFKVRLRSAREGDAGFAEALYVETMMPLLAALGLGDEGRLRTRFARGYQPDCSQYVQVDGRDIGWIQVSTQPTGLHLDQLHLIPGWRNRGVGSYLLAGLLHRATMARTSITLDVIRGNAAIGLYRRLGFHVVGEDVEKFQMIWRPAPP